MDIEIFKTQCWNEIPRENNPTFDYTNNDVSKRHKQCIVICRAFTRDGVGITGMRVVFIPLKGEVKNLGLFWNIDNALLFAKSYADENK